MEIYRIYKNYFDPAFVDEFGEYVYHVFDGECVHEFKTKIAAIAFVKGGTFNQYIIERK
jgi:hypothetical protein